MTDEGWVERAVAVRISEEDGAVCGQQRLGFREVRVFFALQRIVIIEVACLEVQLGDVALRAEPDVRSVGYHREDDVVECLYVNELFGRVLRVQRQQSSAERTQPQPVVTVGDSADVVTGNDRALHRLERDTQDTGRGAAPEGVSHHLDVTHFHSLSYHLSCIPTMTVPADDVHASAVGRYIERTVSAFLNVIYVRMRSGNLLSLRYSSVCPYQSLSFRAVEQTVLSLQRTIDAGLRFEERQHVAVFLTHERPHFAVVSVGTTQVVQLVRRRFHLHAIDTAVVGGNPHLTVAVHIRRVDHIRQSLNRIDQLVFVVVIVTPTAACRVHPCAALVVFYQEEVPSQLTGITAVQRRREAFPLTETVPHDTVLLIGLPDDTAGVHFSRLAGLGHLF